MPDSAVPNEEFQLLAEHLGYLIQELEQDPEADERVADLIHHTLTLYGEALRRLLELIKSNPSGEITLAQMAADEVISAVLLIHGLFPVDLATRLQQALDRARIHLRAHGGDAELVSLQDGVAKVRLTASGGTGLDSSLAGMQLHIRQALSEAAPDLAGVEIEGVLKPPAVSQAGKLVQLSKSNGKSAARIWIEVARVEEIPPGRMKAVETEGVKVLVCRAFDNVYAYRNVCAHQQLPMDKGLLSGTVLTCPWHGYRYDLSKAGECLNAPGLHIDQLPVTVQDGVIKVAVVGGKMN